MYTYISDEQYQIGLDNGISKVNVFNRVNDLGWDIEKAITTPVRVAKKDEWVDIAIKNGITREAYMTRLRIGWESERAATDPIQSRADRARKYDKEVYETMKKYGICRATLHNRIKRGWSVEKASTTPPGQWKLGD